MLGDELSGYIYTPSHSVPEIKMGDAHEELEISLGKPFPVIDSVSAAPFSIKIPADSDLRGRDLRFSVEAAGKSLKAKGYVFDDWSGYVHYAGAVASKRSPPAATEVCEAAMPAFSLLGEQRLVQSPSRKLLLESFFDATNYFKEPILHPAIRL